MELSTFIRIEIWLFLIGTISIIGYKLITGKINTKKLLFDNVRKGFSPGRLQLLIVTIFVIVYYVFQLSLNPDAEALPNFSNKLLLLFGGSNLFYLINKASLFSTLSSLFKHN